MTSTLTNRPAATFRSKRSKLTVTEALYVLGYFSCGAPYVHRPQCEETSAVHDVHAQFPSLLAAHTPISIVAYSYIAFSLLCLSDLQYFCVSVGVCVVAVSQTL